MIDRKQFAESARYMDAQAEELGFEGFVAAKGVDLPGLLYIAEQRALRAAMMADGQDPTKLSRTQLTAVNLSPGARQLMPILQAAVMDGIFIGLGVRP